ncbi:MAG: polymorphic outer membrane protein, partial [uncultured bacterium]
MRHRSINTLTLFFVVTIVWIGLSATAFSTTINVNTLSEEAESGDELCTLTEAINAANSDTAVDCEAGSGADTIELPAGIYVTAIVAEYAYPEINSTITIHGNGTNPEDTHLTRDSSDYVSFFSVAGSGNLTLQNIKLSDGLSDSSARGGAIANNGALTLEHTVFENNANTGRGGAIVNMGSALTISDSTFINNFSASATTGGGALYTAGAGNVDIANSTFVENLALAKDGGAIYVLGNSVTITDSSFSLNQATYFGGAIYVNTADLSITRSTLNDNIGYSGGGVYSATSTLNITQSALYENKA